MLKLKNISSISCACLAFILLVSACKNGSTTEPKSNPPKTETNSTQTSPTGSNYANKVKVKTSDDKDVVEIKFDGGGAKIEFDGKTVKSESKDADKRKYFGANGSQICEVKLKDADGFKVRTTDGKLLWKVKIDNDKIKISDNEENQNAFELVKKDDGAKIEQNENKLGEVKFYKDRQKVKVKDSADKELFDSNTDKYSVSFGVLVLDKIPVELRYVIMAELLSRNL